jgi:hypothetical protein
LFNVTLTPVFGSEHFRCFVFVVVVVVDNNQCSSCDIVVVVGDGGEHGDQRHAELACFESV